MVGLRSTEFWPNPGFLSFPLSLWLTLLTVRRCRSHVRVRRCRCSGFVGRNCTWRVLCELGGPWRSRSVGRCLEWRLERCLEWCLEQRCMEQRLGRTSCRCCPCQRSLGSRRSRLERWCSRHCPGSGSRCRCPRSPRPWGCLRCQDSWCHPHRPPCRSHQLSHLRECGTCSRYSVNAAKKSHNNNACQMKWAADGAGQQSGLNRAPQAQPVVVSLSLYAIHFFSRFQRLSTRILYHHHNTTTHYFLSTPLLVPFANPRTVRFSNWFTPKHTHTHAHIWVSSVFSK